MKSVLYAGCILLSTLLISSTAAVPLSSDESAEKCTQNGTNSSDIVRVLLFPILIREQPIFIINQEDLVSDDNSTETDVPVPSTDMLPPPQQAPVMPFDNRVNPEDDDWDVNSGDDAGPKDVQQSTLDYTEEQQRRKRDTSSESDSSSAENSTELYEIDAWRFGPVLINDTDLDTNSSEIGVLSVGIVRIAPVSLNSTDSNEDSDDESEIR